MELVTEKIIERVASAIEEAQCHGREGPYGLYDYSDYPGNTAPHRVRDFRDPKSDTYGNHVFKSVNREEARAEYERLTREHVAKAAIEAMRNSTDVDNVDLPYHCDVCTTPGYGDAPCSAMCDRLRRVEGITHE